MGTRLVTIGAVVFAVGWNWRLVSLSDDWSARIRGERILRSVEPDALILGWWDTVPLIEYLQLVEGRRPDVQAINRFLIDHDDMIALISGKAEQRPVYVDSPPDGLPSHVVPERAGLLYLLRVARRAGDADAELQLVDTSLRLSTPGSTAENLSWSFDR